MVVFVAIVRPIDEGNPTLALGITCPSGEPKKNVLSWLMGIVTTRVGRTPHDPQPRLLGHTDRVFKDVSVA